jgi:hypothetical protein
MAVLSDDTILHAVPSLAYASRGRSAMLRSGGRTLRYDGAATRILGLLLSLLDGRRRLGDVIETIGGSDLRPAVLSLCARLVDDGMVVDAAAVRTNATVELLDRMLRRPTAPAPDRRPFSTVHVVGLPDEVAAIARVAPAHWSVEGAALDDLLETEGVEGT